MWKIVYKLQMCSPLTRESWWWKLKTWISSWIHYICMCWSHNFCQGGFFWGGGGFLICLPHKLIAKNNDRALKLLGHCMLYYRTKTNLCSFNSTFYTGVYKSPSQSLKIHEKAWQFWVYYTYGHGNPEQESMKLVKTIWKWAKDEKTCTCLHFTFYRPTSVSISDRWNGKQSGLRHHNKSDSSVWDAHSSKVSENKVKYLIFQCFYISCTVCKAKFEHWEFEDCWVWWHLLPFKTGSNFVLDKK